MRDKQRRNFFEDKILNKQHAVFVESVANMRKENRDGVMNGVKASDYVYLLSVVKLPLCKFRPFMHLTSPYEILLTKVSKSACKDLFEIYGS